MLGGFFCRHPQEFPRGFSSKSKQAKLLAFLFTQPTAKGDTWSPCLTGTDADLPAESWHTCYTRGCVTGTRHSPWSCSARAPAFCISHGDAVAVLPRMELSRSLQCFSLLPSEEKIFPLRKAGCGQPRLLFCLCFYVPFNIHVSSTTFCLLESTRVYTLPH